MHRATILALLWLTLPALSAEDSRNIRTGWEIPSETYADQPYVVKTDDGAWLCILTTGPGREGTKGQHVVSLRSTDQGRTWSKPVDVEPADGPEASYAVLLKVPNGRIYAFYNHNTDNLRQVKGDNPPYQDGWCPRVDTQGYFVFKYTTTTAAPGRRSAIPFPSARCRSTARILTAARSATSGTSAGRSSHEGAAYVSLHKVGGFGRNFFTRSEGVLLKSANILTEADPEKIAWETLPDGDVGLRTPPGGGPIAEEQSFCVLSDGSFYCVYRTMDGHPACSYSRDGGHTWSTPQYARYADGRLIKHPRAANFVWKCANGKYLYWFHNHGGRSYEDRNPAWLCGGVEVDSPGRQDHRLVPAGDRALRRRPLHSHELSRSDRRRRPVLSDRDAEGHGPRPSGGSHSAGRALGPGDNRRVATEGLVLDLPAQGGSMPKSVALPPLPMFHHFRHGAGGP